MRNTFQHLRWKARGSAFISSFHSYISLLRLTNMMVTNAFRDMTAAFPPIRSQCTLYLPPGFLVLEKGCTGNE